MGPEGASARSAEWPVKKDETDERASWVVDVGATDFGVVGFLDFRICERLYLAMAIETNTTVAGRSLPIAYIRIAKVTLLEKESGCEALVYVYASFDDRNSARDPVTQFPIAIPYSDQPFAALYEALKQGYPNFKDV